ncbi:trans-aconitate 2-methyltransferase [Streptomyces spectabilis]|uniref:Trans-aconitate 2-methyltransferase n=1 Tax=Streptomyces spectabilis TaxID=68270 RepID=A0A516R8M0_STRST|nr:trans-aconitate 2-methyltransferase [Streptomyces spectabilis]QDQ12009.1 trans-aconitate 2-methyltransferase [Streptomyces spectabilis]
MPSPASPVWDPHQYLRHAGHRNRALTDLLAHVRPPADGRPLRIADLGCGPGNSTALIAGRWPTAHITGYDNSPDMLERAAAQAGATPGGGRVDFAPADLTGWVPAEGYDLILSNATFQWVPGHAGSFAAWIAALAPGGTFAFQVPANFDAPSHALMRDLAEAPRWRGRLAGSLRHADAVLEPAAYLDLLSGLGCAADVWETTYLQVLAGEDAVLDWVKGTGLRPVLTALADDPVAAEDFLAEYGALLREAYPRREHGTVFPFRRLFAVARKDEGAV